jgi:hypothetical protein
MQETKEMIVILFATEEDDSKVTAAAHAFGNK